MAYEVWDTVTSNLLDTYDTEHDALSVLGQVLADRGPCYVEALLLGCEDSEGDSRLIAEGEELVNLVRASRAEPVAIVNDNRPS